MPERSSYINSDVEQSVKAIERRLRSAYKDMIAEIKDKLARLHRDGDLISSDVYNAKEVKKIATQLKLEARKAGYDDVIKEYHGQLRKLVSKILQEAKSKRLPHKLSSTNSEVMKNLVYGINRDILGDEQALARATENIILRSTTGNLMWDDLVKNVSREFKIKGYQAQVKIGDVISSYHTQMRVAHFSRPTGIESKDKKLGVEWWLYDGPIDAKNREFCAHFVGTRVTLEKLRKYADRYGRKHPLSPDISLGGYRCRHQLVPLEEGWQKYQEGPR